MMDDEIKPAFASEHQRGMDLRDWFAGQALRGLMSNPSVSGLSLLNDSAKIAFSVADEMLKLRQSDK